MKNKNLSIVLAGVALILFCVSMVTGLMPVPERIYSICKISKYLGFALLGFSYLVSLKSKTNEGCENK